MDLESAFLTQSAIKLWKLNPQELSYKLVQLINKNKTDWYK